MADRPGHGAIATPWPDGSERWGDFRGEDAVRARLFGIRLALQEACRALDVPRDWSIGWKPAPDISAEIERAREAISAAVAKIDGAARS